MTRNEFFAAIRFVAPITLAALFASGAVMTAVMFHIGFGQAPLHYGLTTFFCLIFTPATAFPLVAMSQRLHRMKRDLESLLRKDSLTDLPNRRAFFEWAQAACPRGEPMSALMIDLDHFKLINDNYGHQVGDCVLRHAAQTIRAAVETLPGAGARIAARIGGEEFAVLLEGFDRQTAGDFAQRLVAAMDGAVASCDGQKIPVTISAGLAHRRPGESLDSVMRAADRACYRAKRTGRNRACLANEAETSARGDDRQAA